MRDERNEKEREIGALDGRGVGLFRKEKKDGELKDKGQ